MASVKFNLNNKPNVNEIIYGLPAFVEGLSKIDYQYILTKVFTLYLMKTYKNCASPLQYHPLQYSLKWRAGPTSGSFESYGKKDYLLAVKKALKENKRFVLLNLTLRKKTSAHANAIIFDTKTGVLERFDPHGHTTPKFNPQRLDAALERMLRPVLKFKQFYTNTVMCPQVYNNWYGQAKTGDPGGFCKMWVLWYQSMKVKFPNVTSKNLMEKMTSEIPQTQFKHFIRNYTAFVMKTIFKQVPSCKKGGDLKKCVNEFF